VATRRVSKGSEYRGDNTSLKSQETRYNFNPAALFVNRFGGRRPDGIASLRLSDRIYFRI